MNIDTNTIPRILFLSTLILLFGCNGANLSDKERDKGPPPPHLIATTQLAEQPVNAEHKGKAEPQMRLPPLPASMPAQQQAMQAGKAMHQAAPAKMAMEGGLRAQPPLHDMVVSDGEARIGVPPQFDRESYNALAENPLVATVNDPLSTFSIDVDTASYSNVRRLLTGGVLPPPGAVRIEEMINYFSYSYPEPSNGPIAIATEVGPCPWRPENKLVRIGLKAKDLDPQKIPPSNLVFLVDVSGSMNQANKLPLLQQSMNMLVDQMTARDRIAIVVYAGSDRVVLQPTAGDKTAEIKAAIASLSSGGSTHASSGIKTAYNLARQSFMPGANNRIILASDGDFNVGVTSRDELERLITKERESGVYLTVLGFGMGNYHDDTMEILADKGNGNYSYIDSLLEARKVLVKERTSTLFTLAKDVKLQVEFNPAQVGAYRLIGYENRTLADEDFHDDKKDAGEIGVGHTITALYELYPVGSPAIPKVDSLKYQSVTPATSASAELLTVKLRYKPLEAKDSLLISQAVTAGSQTLAASSDDFRFAASVAGFGMLLRHPEPPPALTYPLLLELAKNSRGKDPEGYRAEMLRLLETAEMLSKYPQKRPANG
ncbi:MAG: VWA domain-containing protein [Desulforhopalus sp.]|nr:VWA domain-containing protein [Desulforhopalus sp.]